MGTTKITSDSTDERDHDRQVAATDVGQPPDQIAVVGNATRDPVLSYGKSNGTPVCKLGLAVDAPVAPGDWAAGKQTDFYEVVCFRSLAENIAASITKGVRLDVIGRLELDEWVDNDGKQRETKRIVADAVGADLRWATVTVNRQRTTYAPAIRVNDVEPF
jgi:single-strand DNA-binding protein